MHALSDFHRSEYNNILSLLLSEGWTITPHAELSLALLIEKNDEHFFLHFFESTESSAVDWLADEEEYKGELPLWFSERSHSVSPVYLIKKHLAKMEASPAPLPILMLMTGTQIINADAELENWGTVRVLSAQSFQHHIKSDSLADSQTSTEDVKKNSKQSHDFSSVMEGLFESFAVSKRDEEEDEDEDAELNAETDEEVDAEEQAAPELSSPFSMPARSDMLFAPPPFGALRSHSVQSCIKKARFDIKSRSTGMRTLCTHFRPVEQEDVLLVSLDTESPVDEQDIKLCLHNKENDLVAQTTGRLTATDQTYELAFAALPKGHYRFSVRDVGDNTLFYCYIFAHEGSTAYEEHIELLGFGLYRLDEGCVLGEKIFQHTDIKIAFALKGLKSILLGVGYKSLSPNSGYQFVIHVQDEDGACVFEYSREGSFLPSDAEIALELELGDQLRRQGTYAVSILYYGAIILKTKFIIGEQDQKYTFRKDSIEMKRKKTMGLAPKIADPMGRLSSMIGLTRLKRDIKSLVAKVRFDRARAEKGLPARAMPLHLAFLGNPGTGKTTVAKILGQIYKEIGLLEKGHVVVEERGTLTGQNWNSETDLTRAAIEASREGILFIDEAYELVTEHPQDPGRQVVGALLTKMADESYRNWVVVFAGYTKPMERFLSTNPGLRSRTTCVYFDDYNGDELIEIADLWMRDNDYELTAAARDLLEMNITEAYASRDEHFGNARYINTLLEKEVLPAMAQRVLDAGLEDDERALRTIIESDIPNYHLEHGGEAALAELHAMVGLSRLKEKIQEQLNFIRFHNARRAQNIDTPLPPMHMLFTGNPGTGKTSVAKCLGKIYKSMGVLRHGNVIRITRADVVDTVVGGTEKKMQNILQGARGNILLVDEAYNFMKVQGSNDDGHRAIEMLLDALGSETCNMIVILAGYTKEMEQLITLNPGLKGRFPHTMEFPDYNEDELYEIAMKEAKTSKLTLSRSAQRALRAVIKRELECKDALFANGRFAVRLVRSTIMTKMASRLVNETSKRKLSMVKKEDLPITDEEVKMIFADGFDEKSLAKALAELDALVGLTHVKKSLHQFVAVTRAQRARGIDIPVHYPQRWRFVGNFGTGKSSVARILTDILKALRLLKNNKLVTFSTDELLTNGQTLSSPNLQKSIIEAHHGVLFLNSSMQQFPGSESRLNPDILQALIAANSTERQGTFALITAESFTPKAQLAKSLTQNGVYDFNSTLIFEDYTPEELLGILHACLLRLGLKLNARATRIMADYIKRFALDDQSHYANSHTMELLSHTIQKLCLTRDSSASLVDESIVNELQQSHLPARGRMGF